MEVDAVLWSLHCAWLWSGDNANRGAMRKVCPERQASARTLNLKLELSGGQSRGSPIVVSLSLSLSLCARTLPSRALIICWPDQKEEEETRLLGHKTRAHRSR